MTGNLTISPELIKAAHQATAIPSLLIFFIFSILIFLIIGLIFVEKSRNKFLLIWFISIFLIAIIMLGLMFMPYLVQDIVHIFIK